MIGCAVAAVDVPLNWEVPITLNNTVNVGDTVIWTWSDSAPHNVQCKYLIAQPRNAAVCQPKLVSYQSV